MDWFLYDNGLHHERVKDSKNLRNPSVATPLTLLINLTFTKGTFPDILKIRKIFTVHKKNCKTDVNNYRPISLLFNISKIIEEIAFMIDFMYLAVLAVLH